MPSRMFLYKLMNNHLHRLERIHHYMYTGNWYIDTHIQSCNCLCMFQNIRHYSKPHNHLNSHSCNHSYRVLCNFQYKNWMMFRKTNPNNLRHKNQSMSLCMNHCILEWAHHPTHKPQRIGSMQLLQALEQLH